MGEGSDLGYGIGMLLAFVPLGLWALLRPDRFFAVTLFMSRWMYREEPRLSGAGRIAIRGIGLVMLGSAVTAFARSL